MTITEIIESFDQLSVQEQENLLEILGQRCSKLREGEDAQEETFWEMTLRFRQRMEAEGIEFTDDDFADLRDKSPGREVEF